ncbi:MAG: sulfite oxidase-like oxidoreductase [Chloroflexota bacterium]|nr:sulfite oxidase-like oxidoreductase [Chloroflexota bacterium]
MQRSIEKYGVREDGKPRLPPGQTLTEKWPVLHYGGIPRINLDAWELHVWGLVEEEVRFSWEDMMRMPQRMMENDVHCVTRWSKFDNEWYGIPIMEFMKHVRLQPEAKYVMVHSYGGYTTNLPIDEFLDERNLLAYKHSDESLTPDHGWPMRLVVPELYFWKSAKWINGFEFIPRDRRGFWEQYGYHNHGDPWLEERFG